ncbi:MAG: P-loop NTPase [Christensenellaceae bacterium]|jgi:flagellar biosynthesis protein FlhG
MSDQAQKLREMIYAMNTQSAGESETSGGENKASVFCITSGKGGVGKTSFTVNFAIALSRCGKKVAIIDADFGFSNVNIMLGVNSQYNLSHVISGEMRLSEVMEECFPGVWYIAGGSGVQDLLQMSEIKLEHMISQLSALENTMDYILFDTGGGMNNSILRLIDASDETILVITSEPTSILDGYVVLKTASTLKNMPKIRTLINKARSESEAVSTHASFSTVALKYLQYKVDMLGYIVMDDKMTESISNFMPHIVKYPMSMASKQIQLLANKVTDSNAGQDKRAKGLKGFFSRFLRGGQ